LGSYMYFLETLELNSQTIEQNIEKLKNAFL